MSDSTELAEVSSLRFLGDFCGLAIHIILAPRPQRRKRDPFIIEYVNEARVDRQSNDRSLRKAANPADGGSDVFTGLQIGKNDRLGTEHLGSNDGSRNSAAVGQCGMFRPNPYGAIRVSDTRHPVHGGMKSAPAAVDG